MGNNDTGTTTSKSDKASSPVQEQSGPTYPDWATAFQAYYGPGVSLPPPYFGSTIPSGHTPHPYMWGPQPLMPPYGTPAYAAIYSHGGVYAHPAVPLGSHAHGHGVASTGMAIEAMPAGPMGLETQAKSSSSKDQGGLMKKLKGFQGVTGASGNRNRNGNANGNGNSGSLQGGMVCGTSQSGEDGIEGSSDGSDGNTAQEETRIGRKRIGGNMEGKGKSGKVDIQGYAVHSGGEGTASCSRPLEATAAGKPMANLSSSNMVEGMDFRKAKASAGLASPFPGSGGAIVPGGRDGASSEIWDDRERKRERRKQSNRESARRSRMRKQKESEQLAIRVEELNAENIDLKSQLNHLLENSKKLQQENSMLMEKLKSARLEHAGDVVSDKSAESQVGRPSVGLENLLSRVNNSGTSSRNIGQRENESHETKLHQLLESKARADAVAAG